MSSESDILASESGDAASDADMLRGDAESCIKADSSSDDLMRDSDDSDDEAIRGSGGLSPALPARRIFEWGFGLFAALEGVLSRPDLAHSLLYTTLQVSTHFSGVGTVERAAPFLASASRRCLGQELQMRFISACESNKRNQDVLRTLLGESSCIFTNILDGSPVAADAFKAAVSRKTRIDFQGLWAAMQAEGFAFDVGRCVGHGHTCRTSRPDLDVSGSPCQAWSRGGKREGRRSHLTALFLVWCLWARAVQPLVLIHENVLGFDSSMIHEALGDLYEMASLRVCPSQAGFPFMKRTRLYNVLFLRSTVRLTKPLAKVYQHVCEVITSSAEDVALSFCLVATPDDLLHEENRLRSRRGLPSVAETTPSWHYLLTAKQKKRLEQFSAGWCVRYGSAPEHSSSCVFNLTQNPAHRLSQTTGSGAMPTCTRKLFWLPCLGRWMLPLELAVAHGLPVVAEVACQAQVGLDPCRGLYSFEQIGNCMHLANVGCVIATALACLARMPEAACPAGR